MVKSIIQQVQVCQRAVKNTICILICFVKFVQLVLIWLCVLCRAARKQGDSEVERYGAGYLYRSTTAEKPAVTVLSNSRQFRRVELQNKEISHLT